VEEFMECWLILFFVRDPCGYINCIAGVL